MRGLTSLNNMKFHKYRSIFFTAAAAFVMLPIYASASGNGGWSNFSGYAHRSSSYTQFGNPGFPLTALTPAQMADAAAKGLPARGPVLAPQSAAPNAVLLWDEINVIKSASQDASGNSVTRNIVH